MYKDEINYELKISNFNTIVGNQKEDIALEFLELGKWDETQAAKLYFSNVTLPNNSDSYFSNNNNYIKECSIDLNNDLINKTFSFFKTKLKITKNNLEFCKDFDNKTKGLVKDPKIFMTSLKINKGIIIVYNLSTKSKLLSQIDIINNDPQNDYLKGVIIFPIIDICQEGKDIIKQLSINRFPCYLFCKYKTERTFYVIDRMEGIFYLDTFKTILCPNKNIQYNSNINNPQNNNKNNLFPNQNIQNNYNSNLNLRNNMNLSNSNNIKNNNNLNNEESAIKLNNNKSKIKEFPQIENNITFPKNFNNNFSSLNDENNADSAPFFYSGFNNNKENKKSDENNKDLEYNKNEKNENTQTNLISNKKNILEENYSLFINNKSANNIPISNQDNKIQKNSLNISNNINHMQNNTSSNNINKISNSYNFQENKNNIRNNNKNNNNNLNSNKNGEQKNSEKKQYIPDYRDYDFGEELAYYPQFDQFNLFQNEINDFNNNNYNNFQNINIPMSDRDIRKNQEEEMKKLERNEEERIKKEEEEKEKKRLEEEKEKEKEDKEKEEKEIFSMLIPPEPDDNNPDKCIIVFRLPDGEKNIERKFLKTDKISVLYDYIKSLGNEIYTEKEYNKFSIIQTFPYKNFEDKLNRSLEEEGLFPNSMLQIKEIS